MKKLFDLYKEEQLLTVDSNDNVILHPDNQYGFTTYPLPENNEGCILVTEDEYFGLLLGRFMFDETLTKVVDFVMPQFESPIEDLEKSVVD